MMPKAIGCGPRSVGLGIKLQHSSGESGRFQTFWTVEGDQLAGTHERDPVTLLCLVHVMRRHEHRVASLGELADQRPEARAGGWRHSGGGLVEKNHFGI